MRLHQPVYQDNFSAGLKQMSANLTIHMKSKIIWRMSMKHPAEDQVDILQEVFNLSYHYLITVGTLE